MQVLKLHSSLYLLTLYARFVSTTSRCWERYNEGYQVADLQTALAAMQLTKTCLQEWIPDSGATSHMSSDPGIFTQIQDLGSDNIVICNGSSLPIT